MKVKGLFAIILALSIIVSTSSVLVTTGEEQTYPFGEFKKEVWNGSAWVESINANLGDTIRFRITAVYHPTDHPNAFSVRWINITDTLPDCLEFADNVASNPEPDSTSVVGKTIKWYFEGPYYNYSSFTIEFDATVVNYTSEYGEENFAKISGLEKCSNRQLYQEDTANVIVIKPSCGSIDVTKRIWNGCEWVDSYAADVGEDVLFNITITYHAGSSGYKLKNIKVIDTYSVSGTMDYTIHDFSIPPDWVSKQTDGLIRWDLTNELSDGQSLYIEFYVTLTSVEGIATFENCVEVNGDEHCSGCKLSGCDCASFTVQETCEPRIEVIKKVWNGSAWSDYLDEVYLNKTVRFKIDIIYHACDPYQILNLNVTDYLPCCLKYLQTVDITTTGSMDPVDIIVEEDGKIVIWDWTYNNHVNLTGDGSSLTIIFDAIVTNYCRGLDDNWVYVKAWGCSGPTFYGEDNATIDCTPPEPKFMKKAAIKGKEWGDEKIDVKKGDTLTFALILQYFGEDLEEIKFVDVMPCILEYKDNVRIVRILPSSEYEDITDSFTVELSEDGKTVYFNSTNVTLEDGQIIGVEFDTKVVGVTGDCECQYAINYGYVTGKIGCVEEPNFFMDDDVKIRSTCEDCNCPPSVPQISGPHNGLVNENLTFHLITTDPEGENVYYMINWGDNTTSGWLGPYASGVEINVVHSYGAPGSYAIKAKAKDAKGNESSWSAYGYEVVITELPPPQEKSLNVTVKRFSIGRIVFTVTNDGNVDMENIDWIVNVTGGLRNRINYEVNCSIDSLKVNESVTKATGWPFGKTSIPRGFGKIEIKISLSDGDYAKDFEFSGLLIGKIVVVKQ